MIKSHTSILILLFGLLSFSAFSKIEREETDTNENIDNSIIIARITNDDIEVTVPSLIFSFNDVEIKLKFKNPGHTRLLFNGQYNKNKINFIVNGEDMALNFINGEASFKKKFDSTTTLTIFNEDYSYSRQITVFPLLTTIIVGLVILILIAYKMIRSDDK